MERSPSRVDSSQIFGKTPEGYTPDAGAEEERTVSIAG